MRKTVKIKHTMILALHQQIESSILEIGNKTNSLLQMKIPALLLF